MWSGSLLWSGTITVPGISEYKVLGFRFDRTSPSLVVVQKAATMNPKIATTTEADTFNLSEESCSASLSGDVLTVSTCKYNLYKCGGLGQALMLSAGDATYLKEIVGIA